jgi:AcrR family transcriptional regulator
MVEQLGAGGTPAAAPRGPDRFEAVLEAAYGCVAAEGVSNVTVASVAEAAGVSRATIYRWFPGGRDELLAAVVAFEHRRFFLALYEAVHGCASLEEVITAGLLEAHRAMASHEVLQMVLAEDPDLLAAALWSELESTRDQIAGFLVPYLEAHELAAGVDPAEAAGHLARLVLSLLAAPGRWDLGDPGQVAELVRVELLAGVAKAG